MSIFFFLKKKNYILGQVIGGLNTRRGTIVDSEVRDDEFTAIAEVALNDMFGYSNQLRGSTQGKGEFSMEYKVKHFIVLFFSFLIITLRLSSITCQFFLICKRNWKMNIEKLFQLPRNRNRYIR